MNNDINWSLIVSDTPDLILLVEEPFYLEIRETKNKEFTHFLFTSLNSFNIPLFYLPALSLSPESYPQPFFLNLLLPWLPILLCRILLGVILYSISS